ncbi:hypothetical protein [Salinispora pacifica]|uniref:hypothetical protein n=1 Tax=Salinispora pacifica TaxID=351187 RepID=UPI0004887BE1
MLVSSQPVNLGWIYRPDCGDSGRDPVDEHAGKLVRAVGKKADDGGRVEVVLADGVRIQAYRHEVVPG